MSSWATSVVNTISNFYPGGYLGVGAAVGGGLVGAIVIDDTWSTAKRGFLAAGFAFVTGLAQQRICDTDPDSGSCTFSISALLVGQTVATVCFCFQAVQLIKPQLSLLQGIKASSEQSVASSVDYVKSKKEE